MDNQKKKTMKSRAKQFISFALILAIVICGAFAYLTATDSKKNVFTVGDVDIKLIEKDWDANGNYKGELNLNMLPGDEIPKAPYIENIGDNEAWVYVTVGVPTVYAESAEDITLESTDFNIPVNAYAIQDMYGNKDHNTAESVWNAYNEDENITADFGTPLEDKSGIVEIFKIKNGKSLGFNTENWSQIGFYQVSGHNYYVFAYKTKLAAPQSENNTNAQTAPVFTSVVLNPNINAIGTDVLFHTVSTDNVDYFSAEDIGGDVAAEYYGDPDLSAGNFDYEGSIPSDYVPEDGDVYVFGQTAHVATFNSSASAWEITGTVDATMSNNTEIPTQAIGKEVLPDPQADPDPNHIAPVTGDVYEDEYYIYTYNKYYGSKEISAFLWDRESQNGWSVKAKRANEDTAVSYPPMKNEIWGKPVVSASLCYYGFEKLEVAPKVSKYLREMARCYDGCYALTTPPVVPDTVYDMDRCFQACTSLQNPSNIPHDLGNRSPYEGTTTGNYGASMFAGCKSMTGIIDISEVPYFFSSAANTMFYGTELPITLKISYTQYRSAYNYYKSSTSTYPNENVTIEVVDLKSTSDDPDKNHAYPVVGETYDDGTYVYRFGYYADYKSGGITAYSGHDSEWGIVEVKDRTLSSYPAPISAIYGFPVTNLSYLYYNCKNLVEAPEIPIYAEVMNGTYRDCVSLESVPNIPDTVQAIKDCFYNCESLKSIPNIPEGIYALEYTFYNCKSLEIAPEIPQSVGSLMYAFSGCTSLKQAPSIIPENVTNLKYAFNGCSSLVTAPKISKNVKNIEMNGAFSNCTSLTGEIELPISVSSLNNCFNGTKEAITLIYDSDCTVAANFAVPSNVTKVCRDA